MPQYRTPAGITCDAAEAMINGRLRLGYKELLGPGDHVHFDVAMFDSAASAGNDRRSFTDAERLFADSIEGQAAITRAKMSHDLRSAYLGDRAPGFTGQDAAQAIKTAIAQRDANDRLIAQMAADTPHLRQQAEGARAAMIADLNRCRS